MPLALDDSEAAVGTQTPGLRERLVSGTNFERVNHVSVRTRESTKGTSAIPDTSASPNWA